MTTPHAEPAPNPQDFAATDQCVQCGLCLPHCPTYGETQNEADSPRGRISLIQALARGELPADAPLRTHLDGCLGCRACEDICPSGVPYGQLIDNARAELRRRGARHALRDAWMHGFATRRGLRRTLYAGSRWLNRAPGLSRTLRGGPALRRAHALTARLPAGRLRFDAHAPRTRGAVYLFTGCAAEVFDRETLHAARRVLEAFGFEVLTPPAQTCCGALHQHAGDRATAQRLAQTNCGAFAHDLPLIVTSSACAVSLHEYGTLIGAPGAALGARTHEISAFLAARPWPDALTLRPLAARIAVHTPCTQRRVLHTPDAAEALLRHIPQADIIALPGNDRCCGAAGSYMLDHPDMADALVTPKIRAAGQLAPALLATTNIGCAMHLARALAADGQTPEVIHPVSLLARQLAAPEPRA
ncbi:(Fe-S)-binding protein [Acidihalobacter ferrooxydans]|uniref:Glycolate oxidase iron-sulfur subunit n=1 Tax=Acidihalobacter ferrooxydans TaxID=1765967 RepID=A0A1P8UK07_9GAMM|nr:(Fe-S)-binding protein [Acidihalobacter ferrooxydans]APZ44134.1 hypothetical protein BW247_14390 [Acidihalobacter ferrooxydans]